MNRNSVKSEATDPLIYKKLAATHIDILSKCEIYIFCVCFLIYRPYKWRDSLVFPFYIFRVVRYLLSVCQIYWIKRIANIGIGAEVEKKRNSVVERERQKAIRSTEEVVRREEETKRLEVSCS